MASLWLHPMILVSALLVCIATPARADWATVQLAGGAVSPKKGHGAIRMDSEEVIIRLRKDRYSVDAVFHFFNTGRTTTEWVGFPKRGVFEFIRFDTWVDGRKAQVTEERDAGTTRSIVKRMISGFSSLVLQQRTREWPNPGAPKPEDRWLVQHVTFPAQASTTIRTSYEGFYTWGFSMDYILETGAYWKDRIGKITFIIDCTDVGGIENVRVNTQELGIVPGAQSIGDNLLKLELGEAKPPPWSKLSIYLKKTGAADQ